MGDVAAFWGGLPCALAVNGVAATCVYRRARGVDPSVSEITFPRSMFTESLAPLLDPDRLFPKAQPDPAHLELVGTDVPATFPVTARPPYTGDFVFVEGRGEKRRVFRAVGLSLDQVEIVDPEMDKPAVKFTLSDVRRWWENYGEPITRDWNVRKAKGRATSQGWGSQGKPQSGTVYISHTSRVAGADTYHLQEIVQFLLDALPGRLQIIRWPEGLGAGDAAPTVRCWAAKPKEALRKVLAFFGLSLDTGPDLKARIYAPHEGEIGALLPGDPANLDSWTPGPGRGSGVWAARVTADGNRHARRATGAPTRVAVVGDRTVYDVVQDFCTPVLVYPLERPGEPPETVVFEVTPDNLAALARGVRQPEDVTRDDTGEGVLSDPLDRYAVNVLMGAVAPPLPVVVSQGPITGDPKGDDFADLKAKNDPFAWQRLPLLDDQKFEESYAWLPLGVRKLLRDQLWRNYQIPTRRLAPILKRAERTLAGERMEIQVEAFTYKAVRVKRTVPKDSSVTTAQRAADLKWHRFLLDDIGRLKAEKTLLQRPTLVATAVALKEHVDRAAATLGIPNPLWPFGGIPAPQTTSEAAKTDRDVMLAGVAMGEEAATWLKRADALGLLDLLPASVRAQFAPALAALVGARTTETVERRLKDVEAAIAEREREAREAFRKLYPSEAIVTELAHLEAQMSQARSATGQDDPALTQRRLQLRESLAAQAAANKQRDIAERTPTTEPRWLHQNLTRSVVSARVVDADLGVIEILGDLPCWLADVSVQEASSTHLVPMPVRVTFGSWNQRDVDGRGEAEAGTDGGSTTVRGALTVPVKDPDQGNFYMQAAAGMLGPMSPLQRALVGALGHFTPKDENGKHFAGSGQVRFEFERGITSGAASDTQRNAWLEVLDESPPFRELVRLDGSSNREELEARAAQVARPLLNAPDETDAGSLILSGPESVGCNGRISAVATGLVPIEGGGFGFVTEISFDGDSAPLPGIVGRDRDGGPTRLVFGLDPDATRDR